MRTVNRSTGLALQNIQRKNQLPFKVKGVLITPTIAEQYLTLNTGNRKVSEKNIKFLSDQMIRGTFRENGMPIVFDKNNELKDGQHRLLAIVRSGYSYYMPVITGVQPDVMATIDTGKNRSASDVLSMNGFKNVDKVAAFIKKLNTYYYASSKKAQTNGNKNENLTNQQVLDYCNENYHWIDELLVDVRSIYYKSNSRVISLTDLMLIAFMIGGKRPRKEVYTFLKHITGLIRIEDTASSYLFNKLNKIKGDKTHKLNLYWTLGMSIKAWNLFADGDIPVKYIKFDTKQQLPKAIEFIH